MKVVVFDTNVLLDLFVFNDFRALHLKQALIEGKIDALATSATLEEFEDVIARPLFSLDQAQQEQISLEWRNFARVIDGKDLIKSPWVCQDPDDQVFLDLAFTAKPCTLISKDNEVLRFANKAVVEQILITADYTAIDL
ncbi:putative toxin-antitoxin system toxin component, PIN family [Polynucleobacter sp. AP-Capit-er-40B-B4]|uniref:putative toxin-antitoxin system toxin component, PIN family n=1 Tax=Polynucleobacter sp. AP-Capit-er-40B-B4 TaxID=2576927 RepID=UPI001C0E77A7|nr:putative toxin-antitoxin system toxin component, PIN family [Polynucleobacter sp. AP-Capit-er-40B-B4]MBU3582331.1 putative toxin-antitoxin system toxin component, PIN family [Polynucleobacter sp. AP-Capit-er-40B-B4]